MKKMPSIPTGKMTQIQVPVYKYILTGTSTSEANRAVNVNIKCTIFVKICEIMFKSQLLCQQIWFNSGFHQCTHIIFGN